jgi:hypothetical protein
MARPYHGAGRGYRGSPGQVATAAQNLGGNPETHRVQATFQSTLGAALGKAPGNVNTSTLDSRMGRTDSLANTTAEEGEGTGFPPRSSVAETPSKDARRPPPATVRVPWPRPQNDAELYELDIREIDEDRLCPWGWDDIDMEGNEVGPSISPSAAVKHLGAADVLADGGDKEALGSPVGVEEDPLLTPLTTEQEARVEGLCTVAQAYFPAPFAASQIRLARARKLSARSLRRADREYSVQHALAAAVGFSRDPGARARDARQLLELNGDLSALIDRRKADLASNRLSVARAKAWLSPDNPEMSKVCEIAATGMPVQPLLPPDFVCNSSSRSTWPRMSKSYRETADAVNAQLEAGFVAKGLALVLPADMVVNIPGMNILPSGWAPKNAVPLGRPTGNPNELNTKHTKAASDEKWGGVSHCSHKDVAVMLWDFWRSLPKDLDVKWEDLIIFKMDIKGAYTLVYYTTAGARMFATELTGDEVLIYLCGFFGWMGTPAAFQVITRALKHEMACKLRGKGEMFVDDIIVVTTREWLDEDMSTVRQLVCGLLGDGAIAETKTESGRRIEFIGYVFDLDELRVGVGQRCIERAFYAFMQVDTSSKVPVRTLESLASMATRYAGICRYMGPFVRALYSAYRGRRRHLAVELTEDAVRSIQIMRVLLLLTAVEERRFATPFEAMTGELYTGWLLVAEFDSLLTGIGVLWYIREADGTERLVGIAALDLRSLGMEGKPELQNSAEFLGGICGMQGARVLRRDGRVGTPDQPIRMVLRGDSISALTWATTERFRSDLVSSAACAFVALALEGGVEIVAHEHLPAAANGRADYMSCLVTEGRTWEGLVLAYPDLKEAPFINAEVEDLLPLCNPQIPLGSDSSFQAWWSSMRASLHL